jgi:transcriptional regulator with XRE-family HTH domain
MNDMIGVNIRFQREERAWTQEHLATVSGIDVRTIQRAERGENISADSL